MSSLLKQRPYPIRRDNQDLMVFPTTKGYKVVKDVRGGATAPTPQSQAQAAQAALNAFLTVAPKKYYSIAGTIPSGTSGGGTSPVTWTQPIPIVPAFCTAIDYEVTLPLSIVAGANTIQVSPYAPYSAMMMQLTLGGAPPWNLMELTPWYLDQINNRIDYDPFYFGLGGGGIAPFIKTGTSPTAWGTNLVTGVLDQGTVFDTFTGLIPGTTVTGTTTPTLVFRLRIQLQRKRHLLWGAVPFGDPENRPNNISQMSQLVGTQPEQNLLTNPSAGTPTATLTANGTVNAIYELAYIDLLPPGMQAPPQPAVGYGLQVVSSSPTITAAGTITPFTHRTAMIYTDIHHLLINGQLPLRADYFALWDDQDQQSARWSYDASINTFNEYFDKFKRYWRRYPIVGHYLCDFDNGEFPEIPSVTPYDALMTPDQTYAQTFGIPVTPAMTTSLRIPSAVTLSTAYVRMYEVGLVRVPY